MVITAKYCSNKHDWSPNVNTQDIQKTGPIVKWDCKTQTTISIYKIINNVFRNYNSFASSCFTLDKKCTIMEFMWYK